MTLLVIFFTLLLLAIVAGYVVLIVYSVFRENSGNEEPRWIATSEKDNNKGQFIYSDDGKTWKEIPEIDDVTFGLKGTNVAFGNGTWVAVGAFNEETGGEGDPIYYSKNKGIDWIAVTAQNIENNNPSIDPLDFGFMQDISFANGRFIATGNADSTAVDYQVFYSDDGVNWTVVSVGDDLSGQGIGFGDNTWILIADDDTKKIYRSINNGEEWTAAATVPDGFDGEAGDVAYGDEIWFAVGKMGPMVVSTDNGVNWGLVNLPAGYTELFGIAYGGGTWVAVGNGGSGAKGIIYSTDNGVNWFEAESGGFSGSRGGSRVAYSSHQKRWVAVGEDDDANDRVQWSDDGINWNTSEGVTLLDSFPGIYGIGFGLM